MDKTRVYLTESLATKEGNESKSSLISIIIIIIGYLLILCSFVVAGFLIFARTGVDLYIIIGIAITGIIVGILIIGFGYIINLLYSINEKL